jgi:prepilin-type N-terminal cleavage/methylation domain-containing protein
MKPAFKRNSIDCFCSPDSNSYIPHSSVGFTIVELPPSLKFRRASLVTNKNVKQGFTIVELLVVIVVIGILAAITIVSYTGLSSKATVASLQSDLSGAKKQLALYQVEHSNFPTSVPNTTGSTYCPVDDNKYCFKASSGTSFTNYAVSNATNPQTFSMDASKSNTYYHISNNSNPSVVTPVYATGGTVTTDGAYRIHTFTSSGTLTVTTPGTAEVLVVGGGGGGCLGGGGAGGYLTGTETLTGTMNVTIGNGGLGNKYGVAKGATGGDSIFGTRTAKGGGGGACNGSLKVGLTGGSGGGAGGGDEQDYGGLGTFGQGYAGGRNDGHSEYPWRGAGGGGGAQTVGGTASNHYVAGNGGMGVYNDIIVRGTYIGYAGGGGGGVYNTDVSAIAGIASHGGGAGMIYNVNGTAGSINTGGGGGGTGWNPSIGGGNGGSGIVIIRYLAP